MSISPFVPLTNLNLKKLHNLSASNLRVINIGGQQFVSSADLFNFLNQYIGLLSFEGQYATSSFDYTSATSQLLARWDAIQFGDGSTAGIIFQNKIKVRIAPPVTSTLFSNILQYAFYVNVGDTNFVGNFAMSITMENGVPADVPAVLGFFVSGFSLNYYSSDMHFEFGFNHTAVANTIATPGLEIYCDAPTFLDSGNPAAYKDGSLSRVEPSPIAALNSTPSQAMTANPTQSLTLSTNNGTNWYSWATTSTASGGTTNGYV
jgi:hypothetical protein